MPDALHPKSSAVDILKRIAASRNMLQLKSKTAPKFPIIRSILVDIIESLPRNTRLPSIRQIAKHLNTTSVPVQKVISMLETEKQLYVKAKSGIYTGPSPEMADTDCNNLNTILANTLNVATDSRKYRFQKTIWKQITERFTGTNPFFSVYYDQIQKHLSKVISFDVMEIDGLSMCKEINNHRLIDLADFRSASKNGSNEKYRCHYRPLYFQTAYFFYNRTFFRRYRLPEPDYESFTGQFSYFRNLSRLLSELPGSNYLYTILQPVLFLGEIHCSIIHELLSRNIFFSLSERTLYTSSFALLNDFYRLFLPDNNHAMKKRPESSFIEHKAVALIGNSENYCCFKSQTLGFEWDFYPVFCVDNTCVKIPKLGVILEQTSKPIEAYRFLQLIQEEDIQKMIALTGAVPLNVDMYELIDSPIRAVFKEIFQASVPIVLDTAEKLYLTFNVINSEMWDMILGNLNTDELMINLRRYGIAYLKQNRVHAELDHTLSMV